jgi:diguanylate cyclase (GGDEF)-like protein
VSLSRWQRTTCFLLLFVAHIAGANAKVAFDPAAFATRYKLDTWQVEQGLPINTVQSVTQTRNGVLWVGTASGLASFDGRGFRTYEKSEHSDVGIRAIFGFFEDSSGRLWVGHSRGAVLAENGQFTPAFPNELAGNRRVWSITQSKDGALWAASENGLIRWGVGEPKLFQTKDGLPTDRLRAVAVDTDGVLWIATTGAGLVAYRDGKFTQRYTGNGFPSNELRHVLPDPAGGVWASTAGAGLVRIAADGKQTRYTTSEGLPTDQLTTMARDASGAIWIGTWGAGVVRFHEGAFSRIDANQGLGGDQIWSVHADAEQCVWVGTWNGGLSRIAPRPFPALGKPEGLASDNVRATLQTRDGAVLISTAGGGVHRLSEAGMQRLGKHNGLPSDEASALHEGRDGSVWIGSYTNGLTRWHRERSTSFSIAEGLPSNDVRAVWEDATGVLWVGTAKGLARRIEGRFETVKIPAQTMEGVVTIFEDRQGTMWFGTTGNGLMRLRAGVFRVFTRDNGMVSNWILSMYEDRDGALWVGTNGGGLNRIKAESVAAVRSNHGLWDSTVQSIIEDGEGRFWMTTNRGFFYVTHAQLNAVADGKATTVQSVTYGPGYALRNTGFASGVSPAGMLDSQQRLWLPSLKGVVIVEPNRLPSFGPAPAVEIDEVIVDGNPVELGSGVKLPPGSKPLSVRYTANTLLHADKARFRYRIDGINADWVDVGSQREATFPKLAYGNYVFRVAASIDGANWREADRTLTIAVAPRVYQTVWFMVLAALSSIAAIAGLLRWRTHHLQKRHIEMERIVAEKTEALREANVHLERLTRVDALTGLANRRQLDGVLEVNWRLALRNGHSMAVMMIDIDQFKSYNDAMGHAQGDICLVAVAQILRDVTLRAGDLAARYGGEEFCIVLAHAGLDEAMRHAETLRARCEARGLAHPRSTVTPVVTLSVGVAACVPQAGSNVSVLFERADRALYDAKAAGRNCVRAATMA